MIPSEPIALLPKAMTMPYSIRFHLFQRPASAVRLVAVADREGAWNNILFNDPTKQWKWDEFSK